MFDDEVVTNLLLYFGIKVFVILIPYCKKKSEDSVLFFTRSTKGKLIQIYSRCSCWKHIRSGTPEGVSGLYVKLQHVADMGQKSDRQKVAMRPNGWLYKIILPAITLILSSSSYLGTILIQFHPPANATPDFQKREKKEIHFQNAWFLPQIVASRQGCNLVC